MTDNRTTELLCKLLEEHGIAWKKRRGYIRWSKQTEYGVTHCQAWPCFDGTVTLTVRDEYGLTPEQAIAATLGERTCNLIEDEGLLHCSNCGAAASKQSWQYWNHCPNCGAKVRKAIKQ